PIDKSPPLRSPAPPKQDRSRETLRRLVAAARELLDEKGFDEISVAEIAKKGGSSVGAFYARFKDKDTLLDYLIGLYVEDMENWEREREEAADIPLRSVVREAIDALVRMQRRHRGTLRAVALRSMKAKPRSRSRRSEQLVRRSGTLGAEIKKRWREIGHPNPETATRLAQAMVHGVIHERVLFPELDPKTPNSLPITDAVLVEELSRGVLSFLVVNDE
ncbi:MAG: TetR/AcrR family transcriptional regulator, partial [bacterium]